MAQLKLRNTFIYTVLGFLPLSFSIIFTPFYTQYLSKADYGLLNLFNIITGILVSFFGFGIDQAAGFLYWDYSKNRTRMNVFVSTTLILIFLLAVFLFLIGYVCGPWILHAFVKNSAEFIVWPFVILSLVFPFFTVTNRILLYYYRNEGNIKKYAALNVSSLILITAGSIISVISLKLGAGGAVTGRTIGFCGVVLLFLAYEFKQIGFGFSKKIALLLIKMGGPLFISTLIGSVAYVGDRLIVEQSGTLETLGIYGFSVTIASVVEILMGALGNSFNPGIYKTILNDDEANYENTRLQIFMYIFVLVGAAVFTAAIITPFVHIFISDNFFEAVRYIPILCLAFIPRAFAQLFSLKFYKRKKTTYILWLNIAYFISVLLFGTILYKNFGLIGVSISVFLAGLVNMASAWFLSRKLDPFKFHFAKLFSLLLLVSIPVLISGIFCTAESMYLVGLVPAGVFLLYSFLFLRTECLQIINHLKASTLNFLSPKEGKN